MQNSVTLLAFERSERSFHRLAGILCYELIAFTVSRVGNSYGSSMSNTPHGTNTIHSQYVSYLTVSYFS